MAVTDIEESQNGVGVYRFRNFLGQPARNATSANANNYTSTFSVGGAIEDYRSTSRGPKLFME